MCSGRQNRIINASPKSFLALYVVLSTITLKRSGDSHHSYKDTGLAAIMAHVSSPAVPPPCLVLMLEVQPRLRPEDIRAIMTGEAGDMDDKTSNTDFSQGKDT